MELKGLWPPITCLLYDAPVPVLLCLSVLCMPLLVCPSVHPPVHPALPVESPPVLWSLFRAQASCEVWNNSDCNKYLNLKSLEFVPKCTSPGGLSVNGSVFASPVNMCLLRNWEIWSVSLEKWDETKLKPNSSFHITYMYCGNSMFPGQSPVDGCSGESTYGEATVRHVWVGVWKAF